MISSEVQRTLVKSPPELWAELSDPAMLARHLGELGEIRITRVEPEQKLEWEAENTSGTVQIKPSGWGTRVTLTVTRELAEDDAEPNRQSDPEPGPEAAAAPASHAEPEQAGEVDGDPSWLADGVGSFTPEPPAAELAQEATEMRFEPAEAGPEPLGADALEHEPYVWLIDDEPEPRRGFLARLFGRRRGPRRWTEPEAIESLGEMDTVSEVDEEIASGEAEPQPPAALEGVEARAPSEADAPGAPAPQSWKPDASSGPVLEPPPVGDSPASVPAAPRDLPDDAPPEPLPPGDMSSELEEAKEATEAATAEMTAVLTSVLDRLGAAHHRPFSRS